MQRIIYGTDTGSIEALDQCVILLIPDDVHDIEMYIEEQGWYAIPQEQIPPTVAAEGMGSLVMWTVDAAAVDPYDAACEALVDIVGDAFTAAEIMEAGYALVFDVYDSNGRKTQIDLALERSE
jgi:hypothetical protein